MRRRGPFFLLFASKCMLTPKTLVFAYKKIQHNCTQKNKFLETKKKIKLYNNGVRSQLVFLENASFLFVSDLLSLHKAQSKEHMQKRKHFPLCF
jgi:hypothetical protein